MDAAKCDWETALIAYICESAENFSPNLPLSNDWKSSLLLLITLHISIYLKQRTALVSLAALIYDILT